MPIKKSFLESKWYYRVLKVLFLGLPIILIFIFMAFGKLEQIFQTNLSNNYKTIGIFLLSIPLYYLVLKGVWRLFLYIIFGGLEDDITEKEEKKIMKQEKIGKNENINTELNQNNYESNNTKGVGAGIIVVLIVVFFLIMISQYDGITKTTTKPTNNTTTTKTTTNKTVYYCQAGYTYNFSSNKCCPNASPYYYPGTHGIYSAGCYKVCPYVGDCGSRFQKF